MGIKKQFLDKDLEKCAKTNCDAKCCQNISPVRECIYEYFLFHEKIKDKLLADGVNISFDRDMVLFENCSPKEKECYFLKHSPEGIDLRPLECKIYPYRVDWHSIDFDKKVVILFCINGNCPLVKDKDVDKEYRKEVEKIVKKCFARIANRTEFKIEFFKE